MKISLEAACGTQGHLASAKADPSKQVLLPYLSPTSECCLMLWNPEGWGGDGER